REDIDVLLLDLRLPAMDGLEVLRRVKAIDARVPVIIITARDEARLAVEAFKLGVVEYLVKPFDIEPTLTLLRRTLAHRQVQPDLHAKLGEGAPTLNMGVLVGRSPQMQRLLTLLSRVAE